MRRKNRTKKSVLASKIENVNQELQKPSVGLKLMVFLVFLALVLVGLVWQKVQIQALATEIDQLEKDRQKLEESIGTLNSRVLELSDSDRLVKIGIENLHMVYPKIEVIEQEKIYQDSDFKF